MAVKGKKISKAKRNNQKHNKLIKQGTISKSKKAKKVIPPKKPTPINNNHESEESDQGEDMLEMVEADDINFLKSAIANRSYNIFHKLKYNQAPKAKKRKIDEEEEDELEKQYEETIDDNPKKVKNLLPIKTKKGLIPQQIISEENENSDNEGEDEQEPEDDASSEEVEEFTLEDDEFDKSKPMSATQLLTTRNEVLRQKKIHIGTLSSGLLENPEEKVTNLRTLLKIMDEDMPEIFLTVRKLVTVSLLEVFKDILPSYEIKNISTEGVKLKKDTLKLHKYEETLLLYYKKYLQKLERFCFILVKKKGDTRRRTEEELKLGELAVHSMCDLLISHPYFNYASNIAQAVVPFLNHSRPSVRETVKVAIKTIFKEDKKEEITLKILRILNQYLKNHAHNVHTEALEVLLVLNLRDVNLDQEIEKDKKEKKLKSHKGNILQMSKKERKRKKKLEALEKELLETKAEENVISKQRNITEITKIVFNIYFRILKNSNNTKVLGVCLEGLAKFAHCINMEFYIDIVNVLDNLLKEDWLDYREQLHCIQTVFAILGGQGEALNLDPTRFYNSLYKNLLVTNAGRNHENAWILVQTLIDALIKRRKKITNKRVIGFVKRLATLSLQLLHNGSLGCLAIVKNSMQLNKSIDILLDLDDSVGDGKFQPDLEDPEYANATNTALYEMLLLAKHYHPIVSKYAKNIASGVPIGGEGALPSEYWKSTPEELYKGFSMEEMGFNPAVPVPKKVAPKSKNGIPTLSDSNFESKCSQIFKNKPKGPFWIEL